MKDAKIFIFPHDFYVSHHLLAQDPLSKFSPLSVPPPEDLPGHADSLIRQPHPLIHTHGLERIVLDFDANQYFTLFNVQLPPFIYLDLPPAKVLQHCRDLTLMFGEAYRYAHPWYDLLDDEWREERYRTYVCEMGKIVDWILDAAWRYIRHIEHIRLEGEVQSWVREKWGKIFVERGYEVEELGHEVERAWEMYPPACECDLGCWDIGMANVW